MTLAALDRALADVRSVLPAVSGLQLGDGGVVGRYYGSWISSAFQPWRDAAGRIVAFEAYARSQSKHGSDLSPWQLFAEAAVDSDLVTLDRLCRTVHALNFFSRGDLATPLVVNVDARLLQAVAERHGEFFSRILGVLDVPASRLVIEIHTSHLLDLTRLRQVVASYRRHGFAVAVNADSVIHARSLAQLLAPDLLIIDAAALTPETLARHLGTLAGGRVRIAVKRIETPEAFAAATHADWRQGFHLDIPQSDPSLFA